MRANVSEQIGKLHALTRQQLLDMWQQLYHRAAPNGLRREWVVPFLAYRMQENAYGGLQPSTRAELRRIARSLNRSAASTELILRPRIKPGTHLRREWGGETREVVVTRSGYEYRGARYRSLSAIARQITGTRWSGPVFFGLNNTGSVRDRRHD